MNCKYCGAGLPSRGGKCNNCGRMISIDQQREMKSMLDPRLNEYRNKDTALYKKETAYNNNPFIKKMILFIIILVIILLLIIVI